MRRKRAFRHTHAVRSDPSTAQAGEPLEGIANEGVERQGGNDEPHAMAEPAAPTESFVDTTMMQVTSATEAISTYDADATGESTASSHSVTALSPAASLMAEVHTPLQAFERLQSLYSALPSAQPETREAMREQITALSSFLSSVLVQSDAPDGEPTRVAPPIATPVPSALESHSDAMGTAGTEHAPKASHAEPPGHVLEEGATSPPAAQLATPDIQAASGVSGPDAAAAAASPDSQLQPELEALVGEVVEDAVRSALAQQRESFTTTLAAVLERSYALERALGKAHAAAQRAWAPLPAALPGDPPRGVPRPAVALMGDVGTDAVLATARAMPTDEGSVAPPRKPREVDKETALWEACARLAGLVNPSSEGSSLTGNRRSLVGLDGAEPDGSEVDQATARLERCTNAVEQVFTAVAAEDNLSPPRILDVLLVTRAAAAAFTAAHTALTDATARVQQARVRVAAQLRHVAGGAERLAVRGAEARVAREERLLLHGAQALHRALARVMAAADGGLRACLWVTEPETVFGGVTTLGGEVLPTQTDVAGDASGAISPLSVGSAESDDVDGTGACAWRSDAADIAQWRRWRGTASTRESGGDWDAAGEILGEREAALFAACVALSHAPVLVAPIAQAAARALRGACAEPQRVRATGLWTAGAVLRAAAHHWVACPRAPTPATPRGTLGGAQPTTPDLPPAPGASWLSELSALVCEVARTACSDGAVVAAKAAGSDSHSAHTLAAGCGAHVWRGLAQVIAAAAVEVQGGARGGSVLLRRLEAGMGVREDDWLGAAPEAVTEAGDEAAWTSAWVTGAALAQEAIASVELEGEDAAGMDWWNEARADTLWNEDAWGYAAAGAWESSDPTHLHRETVWWSRGEAEGYQHYMRWHGGLGAEERGETGYNTASSSSSSSSDARTRVNTPFGSAVGGSDERELCVRPRVRRAKGVLPSAMEAALSQLAKQDW